MVNIDFNKIIETCTKACEQELDTYGMLYLGKDWYMYKNGDLFNTKTRKIAKAEEKPEIKTYLLFDTKSGEVIKTEIKLNYSEIYPPPFIAAGKYDFLKKSV